MPDTNLNEMWQVEVGGQIYEAGVAELTEWIAVGSLQPDDKVRRGNLRWIEARKVPVLTRFFNASTTLDPVSPTVTVTGTLPGSAASRTGLGGQCSRHPGVSAAMFCKECSSEFCRVCPTTFGGSVWICPDCGGMCKRIEEAAGQESAYAGISAGQSGFGFADFTEALSYPFRFRTSLIMGSIMFAVLTVGQNAGALGGIFMGVAALICLMLANALSFGILANTVENFSQGKIGLNFMPDFDDFNLWDDVVHPFILSIGVYVSSFGAFIAVFIVAIYFVLSGVNAQMESQKAQLERLPGSPYFDTGRTVQQSGEVKKLVGEVSSENDARLQKLAGISPASEPRDTEDDVREAQAMIEQTRRAQLESTFGESPAAKKQEFDNFTRQFVALAAPLMVVLGITFLWGLFFFPAACAVAGYTRSFFATINPMVGLDTIKRLGVDYVKLLAMGAAVLMLALVSSFFLGIVFAALDLPGIGNLPAAAIGGVLTFYFSIVFSCAIGFSLFKASDRLKLVR